MLLDGELVDAPEDVRGLRVDEGDGVAHGSSSGPRQASCAVKKCDPLVVRRDICVVYPARQSIQQDPPRIRGICRLSQPWDGLRGSADSTFYG